MLGLQRGLLVLTSMIIILLSGLNFVEPELFNQASFPQGVFALFIAMSCMFYIAFLINQTTRLYQQRCATGELNTGH